MISFDSTECVVVFGTGDQLVEAVELARELGFEVAAVTAPRQKDTEVRGQPLTNVLESLDVPTIVTDTVNEDKDVSELIGERTLGLSFGSASIFDESLIDNLDGALVNFHGARLPQDRGGGGYSWRILRDDPMGYSQVHLIKPDIDSGDILLTDEYRFPDDCTKPMDYMRYANEQESDLVSEFLHGVDNGRNFETYSQPEYLSSYWPRLSTAVHGYIDWEWSLEEIVRFVRAFSDPYQGSKTFVNGTEVHIKQCESFRRDGAFHPFQTGIVYRKRNGRVFIATPEGSLIVGSISDKNGESVIEKISLGDRLYTPTDRLEQARRTRVYYTPTGMRQDESVDSDPSETDTSASGEQI
jgi:methionyl-tRNA formyltransferase